MEAIIYDFDKTIYDGDSTINFYKYCLKKKPSIIKYIFKQVFYVAQYLIGIINKEKMKEKCYCFLKGISNIDEMIESYWEINKKNIKKWYMEKNHSKDIIISASPEFLLEPICKYLKVYKLIASQVDKKTGKLLGKNCYGEEKVKRLFNEIKNVNALEMYTDSYSDEPLIKISKEGYMVDKNNIYDYYSYKMPKIKKLKKMFFSQKFITFVFVGCINTINGILFSYLYSLLIDPTISFIFGYATSLIISYLLNSYITFKDKELSIKKLIKFCISYIPNFTIQFISVSILINIYHINKIITYGISAVIGIPITFIVLSLFTFKKEGK